MVVDVVQNPNAKMHKRLQYNDVMTQNLRVMDETAITLCKENEIPVRPPCICFWCKSFILRGVPDTLLHLYLDAEQCFPSITSLKRCEMSQAMRSSHNQACAGAGGGVQSLHSGEHHASTVR